MNAQHSAARIVAGAATILVTGSLLFAMPGLSQIYTAALTSGDGIAVARESPLWWSVGIGCLAYAGLVHLAIGSRRCSVAGGAAVGAGAGLLLWAAADFMLFGISGLGTLAMTVIAPLMQLIPGAAAGVVMVLVSARTLEGPPYSVSGRADASQSAAR